jgi:hypothetical protein
MANITKAVDFDSHVYSNKAVMECIHDVDYQLLVKFNKSYSSDQTRDGGAKSSVGISQFNSSMRAKLGEASNFTNRRDYQTAMAPRGTSAHTSDSESNSPTRPPVLRLRGAGKLDLGESDCRSEDDTSDLAEGIQIHQLMSVLHTTKRISIARSFEVICNHVWRAYHSQFSMLKTHDQTL